MKSASFIPFDQDQIDPFAVDSTKMLQLYYRKQLPMF